MQFFGILLRKCLNVGNVVNRYAEKMKKKEKNKERKYNYKYIDKERKEKKRKKNIRITCPCDLYPLHPTFI